MDSCAVAVAKRDDIIDNARITPGLSIVGFSSAGKANYESIQNSGIGSNGLTSARHELLSEHYSANYPETYDPTTDSKYAYCGPHRINDPLPNSELSVGQALLSPTRTYLPLLKSIGGTWKRTMRSCSLFRRRSDKMPPLRIQGKVHQG